jgi:hypothetical protein
MLLKSPLSSSRLKNPKIKGMDEAALWLVESLYELAKTT